MKALYFDCPSGASGDMILGALVDAGADVNRVMEALAALELDGWELRFQEVRRGALRALKADVKAGKPGPKRGLREIEDIIGISALAPEVRDTSLKVFRTLAEAEAQVHGIPVEDVHFHEVGALDAVVDIVGSAAALATLSADMIVCSPLPMGSGTIETDHGVLPVPVPAVAELLKDVTITSGGKGELVTPTGAAFLVAVCDRFGVLPDMELQAVGAGAGEREDTTLPNVLRVFVGEVTEPMVDNTHLLLEANLDDMVPEIIPYAIERLIEVGADDAWAQPITMKKERPALLLSILCKKDHLDQVLETLYAETTTLGVRIRPTGKHELERESTTIEIEGYEIRVKIGKLNGRVVNIAPEFEDAAKVARITGLPLKEIYRRTTSQL